MIFSADLNKLFRNGLLVLGLVCLFFLPAIGGTELRAVRGNGVWINCTFDPARMKRGNVPVSWYLRQGNGSRRVQHYENGVDHLQHRTASRRGRIYPDKFKEGDAALFIENVQMSDEGHYECVVVLKDDVTSEITVLTVLASSEPPQLTEALDTRSFTCSSRNGFPPALVSWTGGSGMNYTLDRVTQHTLNPEGLYDVVSKLTRRFTEAETICCTVWNQPLQENKTNCMRVTPGQETDDQHIIMIGILILVTPFIMASSVGIMIYLYLYEGAVLLYPSCRRQNLATKRERISNCSHHTVIVLIGKPEHGVPSLINSCVYAYKTDEPFKNRAGAMRHPPHYAKPEEVPLTEHITITRALLQPEDRFWTSERDSYLDNWRREAQSHRRPFVFVHSCINKLTATTKDEIHKLFEDVRSVSGSYPFTALTMKSFGNADELKCFFKDLGSKRVFSFDNYTIHDPKRRAKRDEEFLDFVNACIDEAVDTVYEMVPLTREE